MKPKICVKLPSADEKMLGPLLAVLKEAAGDQYDVDVEVPMPTSDMAVDQSVYTFVNPVELPKLLAVCTDPALHRFRDRLATHASDLKDETCKKYREAAQKKGRDGELEVDDNAIVSISDDDGAYVSGWVWVYSKEAGIKSEEEE